MAERAAVEAESRVAVCVCRRRYREGRPGGGMGVAYEAAEDVEDGGGGCV